MSDFASEPDQLPRRWTAAFAVVAGLAVLWTQHDPGLTVDEPINVGHGKKLVFVLFHHPLGFFESKTVEALWKNGHEHPPLCRFLIGLAHALTDANPDNIDVIVPKAGRPVGALAFAFLIWTCMEMANRMGGKVAGIATGLAAALMPRLFGHAHLASPEVISAALFLQALNSTLRNFGSDSAAPTVAGSSATGFWIGLALLAKLTNILLLPTVAIYAVCRFRVRAFVPLFVCGLAALLVFVGGWPWLWPFDLPGYRPGLGGAVQRLKEFFGVGLNRATIYVWYFGNQYPNAAGRVPWHYAWFFFGATVPLATLLFGIAGAASLTRTRRGGELILLSVLATLGFFTFPIERYDGERIFLFAFPPFAILAGLGAAAICHRLRPVCGKTALYVVLGCLAISLGDIVSLHPAQLSYYNVLVGGLAGADRLGVEATYWGDSITEEFLDKFAANAEPDSKMLLLPTLYPGHAAYLTTNDLSKKRIEILPGDNQEKSHGRYALLFNRAGYIHDPTPNRVLATGKLVAELRRQGVWLTRIYKIDLPAN